MPHCVKTWRHPQNWKHNYNITALLLEKVQATATVMYRKVRKPLDMWFWGYGCGQAYILTDHNILHPPKVKKLKYKPSASVTTLHFSSSSVQSSCLIIPPFPLLIEADLHHHRHHHLYPAHINKQKLSKCSELDDRGKAKLTSVQNNLAKCHIAV